MSAAPETNATRPVQAHRRKSSFGKDMFKRMKSVLKRDKSSKDVVPTLSGVQEATTTDTAPTTIVPASSAAVASPAAPVTSTTQITTATAPETSTTTTETPTTRPPFHPRYSSQQARARKLFEKYNLPFNETEWAATPAMSEVQRVEKPIRMRVHRTCHHCSAAFGSERVCPKCDHPRCKKCPRYPPKKPKTETDIKSSEPGSKKLLQDAKARATDCDVPQPKMQRIHRYCHKCEAEFVPPTATVCSGCTHVRCTSCPRIPAKKKKYPTGYPGDVAAEESEKEEYINRAPRVQRTIKKTRQRVRWTCESCSATFIDGNKTCPGCGHQRCDGCTRKPPRKAPKQDQAVDSELLKRVEEKLAALSLAQGSPAA